MPSSLLEIIELPNGDIVLQRADEEGEPLLNIRFSKESRDYIDGSCLDIAKVMIQAGIQAAAHMENATIEDAELEETVEHVIH